MHKTLAELRARVAAWFDQARAGGWLDDTDVERLAAVEQGTPDDLFAEREARPLVVALFGGTGVGKSSLLNRLAGAELARTGVERPTSRETTAYVHESVGLAGGMAASQAGAVRSEPLQSASGGGDETAPPSGHATLPFDAVRVVRHAAPAQRDILWLDVPDIDSTEEAHRRAALAWLPHVDLVCYVVSPERYRDDVGWRVLRARGERHGWVFVINRWDEGDPAQAADFQRMMREAGFEDPILLLTCCVPGRATPTPDQFGALQRVLEDLLRAHGLRELERLGLRARLMDLRGALEHAVRRVGPPAAWDRLGEECETIGQAMSVTVTAGANWSIRAIAARCAARPAGLLEHVRRGAAAVRGQPGEAPATPADVAALDEQIAHLWDDWMQTKLRTALDELEVAARRIDIAGGPLRRALDAAADAAGATVSGLLRDEVRAALARSGGGLIRALRKVTGFLMAFLPALALVWVAYAVLRGYHAAVQGRAPYLGIEFAVNSGLVVLIAWALPYTADRLLRPSFERLLMRALRTGLDRGLAQVATALRQALEKTARQAAGLRDAADVLRRDLEAPLQQRAEAAPPVVGRVLVSS